MDLSALAKSRTESITRSIEADLGGGEILHAVIRPAGVSSATAIRINALQKALRDNPDRLPDDAVELIPRYLSEYVQSWDAELDGVPVPTTMEGMASLPIDLLQFIMSALQEAASGAPFETSESSKPSRSTARKPRRS